MSVETIALVAAVLAALILSFMAFLLALDPRVSDRKISRMVRAELARIERESALEGMRMDVMRAWEDSRNGPSILLPSTKIPDFSPADYRQDTAQIVDGPIVPEWMVRELNVAPDEAFSPDSDFGHALHEAIAPAPSPETRPMHLLPVEDDANPRLTRYMPTGRPVNGKEK